VQLRRVFNVTMVPKRVIAVDWSGARDPRRTLWLAECTKHGVVSLEHGFTHPTICDRLLKTVRQHRDRGEPLAIGLDFAFGYPAAFAERHHCGDIAAVWALAERRGDGWMRCEEMPFWGRAGCGADRAAGWGGPRATDAAVRTLRLGNPKSPYQVTGAGAVGSSTIRGLPVLRALRAAGAAIWPFDRAGLITVMELYPRIATGAVVKRDPDARAAWLQQHAPELPDIVATAARESEDAFDALAAARFLWQHRASVPRTDPPTDPRVQLEGAIWIPDRLVVTPVAE
jgi:hypothetical protein